MKKGRQDCQMRVERDYIFPFAQQRHIKSYFNGTAAWVPGRL